jgi:hypothetical protein
MPLRPDDVHRTVLLTAHDGTQPTLDAVIAAHDRTGIVICAGTQTCRDTSGQVAILTAVVTARRAFGAVTVHAEDPAAILTTGIFKGQTVATAVASQGARPLPAAAPARQARRGPCCSSELARPPLRESTRWPCGPLGKGGPRE